MKNGKEIAVLPDSKELGEEARSQVQNIQYSAREYTIGSHEMVHVGEGMLKAIKMVKKEIDERKSDITRPLMKSLASVRDLFKPFEEVLAESEKTIKGKILAYTLEQEEIQLAEAAKIEGKVAKGTLRADTAASKLTALDAKKVNSNVRTVKKLLITDESLIPREFLDVNRMKVTEALWAGITVPGAKLVEEKQIVIK